MSNYDAVLFLSFGGPEGMDDVMPFLANVLRGKNVPESRMREVAHHYERFGGVSPINGQNRQLIDALRQELESRSIKLPIYWGNRNWHPMLADTLKKMEEDGIKRALVFVTSAYSSYSGCRQYLEDMQKAEKEIETDIVLDKVKVFYDHPLFIESNIDAVRDGLQQFKNPDVHVIFTAHSIPMAMSVGCDYVTQLSHACELTARALEIANYKLVYQSRSGPPSQPWLEPDVLDHMKSLSILGVKQVLIHPIGFISDHMEILYDLDTEAKDLAGELNMEFVRTSTAGTNPKFARMMADLVQERLESNTGSDMHSVSRSGPAPECSPGCCAYTPARPAPGNQRP